VNGTIYPGGAVAQQAQSDVTVAYNDVAGRACNVDLSGTDLGGLTLTEAVYCFSSSAQLTGQLVLDAEGNADALFIFQIGSMLTTASNSSVLVINNGTECNVYWQVGSSATLGTSTAFAGNILALTSITLNTGADVSGRSLARNGAVTMDSNDIFAANCTETPTNVSLSNFGNDSPGINIGLGLFFLVSFLAIAFWSWRNHRTYPPTGGVK
jgi:type VI secretion system secreted protein VgrG